MVQQRREGYERHIRELEDELREREREKKEIVIAAEADQEGQGEEGGARERRRSTLLSSSPNKFDYSAYHDPVTFTYPEFAEREVGSARRPL